MARQTFPDLFTDPPIAVATYTTQTINPLWVAARFTPIFANDPKAGKVYRVTAGGHITMSVNTCTLILTPKYGTGGTSLGAGPAQTLQTQTTIPWRFSGELVFYSIGAAGANSTCFFSGAMLLQGIIATAGNGCVVTCGSTAAVSVDASILANIEVNTTLGGTQGSPSITCGYAFIQSLN